MICKSFSTYVQLNTAVNCSNCWTAELYKRGNPWQSRSQAGLGQRLPLYKTLHEQIVQWFMNNLFQFISHKIVKWFSERNSLERFGKSLLNDCKQFIHSDCIFKKFSNNALLPKGRLMSFKLHLFQINRFFFLQQVSPNNGRSLYEFCFT